MNGTFMYASEIKSLLRHPDFVKELNAEALKPYMTFQYPAIGETFFKGVYKLPEGHYFTYRDGKMDIHRYYDEDFREGKQKLGELVNSIDQTVCDSVKAHQIADVEVAPSCRAVSTPATSPPWRVRSTRIRSVSAKARTTNRSRPANWRNCSN